MLLFRDYVRTVFTPELVDPTDCDCATGSEGGGPDHCHAPAGAN